MVNSIVDGITERLLDAYGDNTRVYADEEVAQGLVEPCFFIRCLNPAQVRMIGQRYRRTATFDIHYFPETQFSYTEAQRMGESLLDELEYIALEGGGLLMGTAMHYEVTDGVLHFFVDYNAFVVKPEEKQNMEELTELFVGTEE